MELITEQTFSNKITYYVKKYESYGFRRLHFLLKFVFVISIIGFFIWLIYSTKKRAPIKKLVKRMINRIKHSTYACNLLKENLGSDSWKSRIYKVAGMPIEWGLASYIG